MRPGHPEIAIECWSNRGGVSLAELDGKLWLLGGKTGVSANSNPQDIWYMTVEPATAAR